VELVAVEQAALEREQLGLAVEGRDRLGRHGDVAADERERGRALEQALEPLGAGLVGRALGQRVLDDAKARVGVAQARAHVRRLRDGDAAEVHGEDGLRLAKVLDDLGDRRCFLCSVQAGLLSGTSSGVCGTARPGSLVASGGYAAVACAPSPRMSRVRDGSTFTPGPIVEASVTDRM
jgi:hypothetical protein